MVTLNFRVLITLRCIIRFGVILGLEVEDRACVGVWVTIRVRFIIIVRVGIKVMVMVSVWWSYADSATLTLGEGFVRVMNNVRADLLSHIFKLLELASWLWLGLS